MASTFDTWTICAGPTAALAPLGRVAAAFVLALALPAGPALAAGTALEVQVQGLRNAEGMLRLCLTRNPAFFPDCSRDPEAVRRSVPAGERQAIHFDLAGGTYALAVIHDENANGRLDRFMAIPREGFGFSRNPRIRMGPPRYEDVRFDVAADPVRQIVRMRYLL